MAANYELMLPDIEEIQAEREEKIQRDLTFFSRALSFFVCLSKPKRQKRTNINRDYYGAHERLVAAYFNDNLMFPASVFEDRFRMSRSLFTSIVEECTSAIRQLAYDTIPDALDEYLQMGHAISRQFLEHFCTSIKHGRDHGPDPFILLEVVASQDLWIWHAFFGVSGANNDINVTQRSPLLNDLKLGKSSEVPFVANDYKAMHEAERKDVERAFGVLKKQWAILATPARGYIKEKLANIMYTCIILHNMVIKDCKEAISPEWYPEEEHQPDDLIRSDEQRYRLIMYIKSSEAHQMLKADLIEHVNRNRND
ncbi:ALP1-like protein [Tanacetum coccineum]